MILIQPGFKQDSVKGEQHEKEMILGIVTHIDLLNFVTLNQKENGVNNGELHYFGGRSMEEEKTVTDCLCN